MANAKKVQGAPRKAAKTRSSTIRIIGAQTGVRKVRFGAVTVEVSALGASTESTNVLRGQQALESLGKSLAKPGVTLVRKKGVPYFHSDPKFPGRVVRIVNGKERSGVFDRRGVFKPSKTIVK